MYRQKASIYQWTRPKGVLVVASVEAFQQAHSSKSSPEHHRRICSMSISSLYRRGTAFSGSTNKQSLFAGR